MMCCVMNCAMPPYRGRKNRQRVGRWGREEEASCVEVPPGPRESQRCTSTITHQHPNNRKVHGVIGSPVMKYCHLDEECQPLILFQQGDEGSYDDQWEEGVSYQAKRLGVGHLKWHTKSGNGVSESDKYFQS